MAKNSKVTQVTYWNDNSAWVERDNQNARPDKVYENLTQSTLDRLEILSFKVAYEINLSLRRSQSSGIAVFISRAQPIPNGTEL